MKRIHMVAIDGMITITSDDFAYSNIRNMYRVKSSTDTGAGLQVNAHIDADLESEIMNICDQVAELMYKLEDRTRSTSNG